MNEDKIIENFKVYCRIRPLLSQEKEQTIAVKAQSDSILSLQYRDETINAKLSKVFGPESTQSDIITGFSDLSTDLYKGINSTVLAYGQTGSGKTFSMFGEGGDKQGVIPRALNQTIQGCPGEASVYLSFMQIYNEMVYDLLGNNEQKLEIKEDKVIGTYVKGITEFRVRNEDEGLWLLARGEKMRAVRETKLNTQSSRSHLIVNVRFESITGSNGLQKSGKLKMCDLAGSERMTEEIDYKKQHFKELKHINLSLTTLSKVIQNLSGSSNIKPPFRESRLTRLLKDCLTGNGRTYVMVTLGPSFLQSEESMNSLRFARNAQTVKTQIVENEIDARNSEVIKELQKEIKYLKQILSIKSKGGGISDLVYQMKELRKENEKLREGKVTDNSEKGIQFIIEENKRLKAQMKKLVQGKEIKIDEVVNSQNTSISRANFPVGGSLFSRSITKEEDLPIPLNEVYLAVSPIKNRLPKPKSTSFMKVEFSKVGVSGFTEGLVIDQAQNNKMSANGNANNKKLQRIIRESKSPTNSYSHSFARLQHLNNLITVETPRVKRNQSSLGTKFSQFFEGALNHKFPVNHGALSINGNSGRSSFLTGRLESNQINRYGENRKTDRVIRPQSLGIKESLPPIVMNSQLLRIQKGKLNEYDKRLMRLRKELNQYSSNNKAS